MNLHPTPVVAVPGPEVAESLQQARDAQQVHIAHQRTCQVASWACNECRWTEQAVDYAYARIESRS